MLGVGVHGQLVHVDAVLDRLVNHRADDRLFEVVDGRLDAARHQGVGVVEVLRFADLAALGLDRFDHALHAQCIVLQFDPSGVAPVGCGQVVGLAEGAQFLAAVGVEDVGFRHCANGLNAGSPRFAVTPWRVIHLNLLDVAIFVGVDFSKRIHKLVCRIRPHWLRRLHGSRHTSNIKPTEIVFDHHGWHAVRIQQTKRSHTVLAFNHIARIVNDHALKV